MKIGPALERGRRALRSKSETPSLDVQVLLADILQRDRAWILAHPEAALSEQQRARYLGALEACQSGEALPHVLGWWEFYGRRFRCPPQVLIPRPETELLVERALDLLRPPLQQRRLLDVGTGSGCVAVTLAAEIPDVMIFAVDIQRSALRVAQQNALKHRVGERVKLVCADLLRGVVGRFDLICANLPYVPTAELRRLPVGRREPWRALNGGDDGLDVLRRLVDMLPGKTTPGGAVLLEIGDAQAKPMVAWIGDRLRPASVEVVRDLAGKERLLHVMFGEDS